ncbi:hypothetical protein D9613_002586 [Agrocybe pediades]|uniref:Mitochondrial distribution and morphology protein 12 n=1 Tax=Agrocybe pediades TaxID=84607 RepID=A0A8H4VME0_9AGAR|nr:hypothetical protein D9613_002586 [Agrocybe pediades]
MSIDLEWVKLDDKLASYLVDVLNRQLGNAERPSFIGPIEVTSLEFGSTAPDVELVDLRDIYRDFLEDDEDDPARGPVKVTEGAEDEEGFEWVSRRAVGREESLAYQHLPPHVRYGRGGPTDLPYGSMPAMRSPHPMASADMWNSTPNLQGFGGPAGQPLWQSTPMYRSPTPATPFAANPFHRSSSGEYPPSAPDAYSQIPMSSSDSLSDPSPGHSGELKPTPEPPQNPHPNLQVHLHINWHSNLRVTLTTSLLINYPSPMFMSLPIKLSVTGIVFDGEVAVAYEGERKRIHLCILDDLDPYGPAAGSRSKRDSTAATPPEGDDDSPPTEMPSRPSKPLPIGQRLLPSIYIESEIGQADKHVLKNVTRVERFIQDIIRKTVEEELVFPNFHTLVMGDG